MVLVHWSQQQDVSNSAAGVGTNATGENAAGACFAPHKGGKDYGTEATYKMIVSGASSTKTV